jgi:hypothetical protein
VGVLLSPAGSDQARARRAFGTAGASPRKPTTQGSVVLIVQRERLNPELAILLDQLFDALLRFLEALLTDSRQLHATLERSKCLLERLLAGLHLFNNLLEFGQRLLEVGE